MTTNMQAHDWAELELQRKIQTESSFHPASQSVSQHRSKVENRDRNEEWGSAEKKWHMEADADFSE